MFGDGQTGQIIYVQISITFFLLIVAAMAVWLGHWTRNPIRHSRAGLNVAGNVDF